MFVMWSIELGEFSGSYDCHNFDKEKIKWNGKWFSD